MASYWHKSYTKWILDMLFKKKRGMGAFYKFFAFLFSMAWLWDDAFKTTS